MSKTSLAPRARSPKAAPVVPIRPGKPRPWGPVEHARSDFEVQSELTSISLRGLRSVLDAWMVYERENVLGPDGRDEAFQFLGDAIVSLGERLEAKRRAWHEADTATATKKPA